MTASELRYAEAFAAGEEHSTWRSREDRPALIMAIRLWKHEPGWLEGFEHGVKG